MATTANDQSATSQPTGPAADSKTCEGKIDAVFNQVPRKDSSVNPLLTSLSDQELFNTISVVTSDKKVGINAFIFPYLFYYENTNKYVQNNLYNFILKSANNQKLLGPSGSFDNDSYIDGCLCYQLSDKEVVPMATFPSFNDCITAFVNINKVWVSGYMKNPTLSGVTYDIEPRPGMTESEKEQLYSSIQNCWTKYNAYMGGSKVTEEQNQKIRKYMNLYLSLL